MNWLLYAELIANLARAVVSSDGRDHRALGYIQLATAAARAGTLTDAELTELQGKYEAEVSTGAEVTPEQLSEIDARIAARSAQIQSA